MESNNNDNYVLVLEDRTEVKNEKEAGKLSVVSAPVRDKVLLRIVPIAYSFQCALEMCAIISQS